MKTTYTNWLNGHKCESCTEVLERDERFDHAGRCPKCGYKGECTMMIVNTTEFAYRYKITTWWSWRFPFYHKVEKLETKDG